jgi:hypothetical protein
MTYRKLAFWCHKAPKQNIHGDHSPLDLHRHFQPANGDPLALRHAPTGLLHMSGRIAEVTADPFGHNTRRIQRDRKSLAETRWRTNMPPTTTMEMSDTTMITMVVTKVVVATGMSRMIIITVRMFQLHDRFFSGC